MYLKIISFILAHYMTSLEGADNAMEIQIGFNDF